VFWIFRELVREETKSGNITARDGGEAAAIANLRVIPVPGLHLRIAMIAWMITSSLHPTLWYGVLLEKLVTCPLMKKFPAVYVTRMLNSYPVQDSPTLTGPCPPSQLTLHHILKFLFSICFCIMLQFTLVYWKWCILFVFSEQISVHNSRVPPISSSLVRWRLVQVNMMLPTNRRMRSNVFTLSLRSNDEGYTYRHGCC
jgi:hypothetical protein